MRFTVLVLLLILCSSALAWHGPWPPEIDTVTAYWPNGQLKEEYYLLNQSETPSDSNWVMNGLHRTWHENGQLHEVRPFFKGHPEGWFRSYHPNGALKEEGEENYFGKFGVWVRWYDNGERAEETVHPILGGYSKQTAWLPDGKINREVNYHDGEYHGLCFWAEADDHDYLKAFYFDGKRLFDRDSLTASGISARKGSLFLPELDLWVEWDAYVQNVWVGRREGDERIGIWTHFYPNGKIDTVCY